MKLSALHDVVLQSLTLIIPSASLSARGSFLRVCAKNIPPVGHANLVLVVLASQFHDFVFPLTVVFSLGRIQ
jgi:hypothetical protein